MTTIAMFNNKGGVGKTTLTNNIASFIADSMQKRILVVDYDPQCNTTQLLMGQEFASELYWEANHSNRITTISDILQPIEDGDSQISDCFIPVKSSETRFNVDLIPGNPKFSIIIEYTAGNFGELNDGLIDLADSVKTHRLANPSV